MATLNIGGQKVTVDDSFMSLPPDQQSATVEEIHASMGGGQQAPSIPRAIADVPRESYSATANALSSIASNLNPFSDARRKAYENKDLPLGSMLSTGQGLMGVIGAPFAPIQGALRSLVGHPLDTADTMLRSGATKIHGDENVAPPIGYEGAKNAVDTALMGVAPRGASPIAVTPRAAPPVPPTLEANVAAQSIGVDLPRAIGTDSQFTRFMGQVSNKMPGGGPMQEGIGNALKQTGAAVTDAAGMAGGTADPLAAGARFGDALETSFKPTIKSRLNAAYDEVSNHLDPTITRVPSDTIKIADELAGRRASYYETDPGKAVKAVLDPITDPRGLTYDGIKNLRTSVGDMLEGKTFPEGMSQKELEAIYAGLSKDLRATVQVAGGPRALAEFERANRMASFAADWKTSLSKVLGNERSGENVSQALLRTAAEKGGDLKTLMMARAAVPKDVWQDIASTAVSRLGLDKKGEFSPNIFMNDFAALSDRGKKILFGSVGTGDVLPHLNDIATVSKKFVEAGKLTNTSGTAGHNALYTMLGGAAAGLMHGSLIEPMAAVSTVVGNNLMARALSKPASAASVARWGRAYQTLAASPGPSSFANFNIAARNLANTINGQFGSRIQPADFLRAIQGPTPGRAEGDQPQ
jgi:hypothetical protein